MRELGKFIVAFSAAVTVVVVGLYSLVRPCNLITVDRSQQKLCRCMGKVVNLRQLRGRMDAFELPKVEHCVGIVRKK